MITTNLSPLEQELQKLEKEKKIKLPLADLVMMQMVGNFPQFLQLLSGELNKKEHEAMLSMIEETREAVTTPKLFSSIVQKTITAQFGDKHAALRELGQNALDSYNVDAEKKHVFFDVHTENDYHVLRVRDFGVGMDGASLVKNLLIPYNSGKEFDPNKIGEHGIGWYSIVDLSEVVKVTTKTAEMKNYVQALIHRESNEWMATLSSSPEAQSGSPSAPFSTEVQGYICKDITSLEGIRNYLFQYLGLVDDSRARIFLGTEMINSVRAYYQAAAPVEAIIDDTDDRVGQLTMSISKRAIRDIELKDSRFAHRNKNLNSAVFTQHGLFVKYGALEFDQKSMHYEFLEQLQDMSLDLWVDLPGNVTLTKGRNNIIADHSVAVLEAEYQAFENLFLDVILSDDELLYHSSGMVLEKIAYLFDKSYKHQVRSMERSSYSLGRRFISRSAAIAVGAIDIGSYAAYAIYRAAKYGLIEIPKKIGRTVMDVRGGFEEEDATRIKELTHKTVKVGVPVAASLGAAGYGIYKLQDTYGWDPFIGTLMYAGAGLASLAALGATVIYGPRIVKAMPGAARSAGEGIYLLGGALYEWARNFKLPRFEKNQKSLEQRVHDQASHKPWLPLVGDFCKNAYMTILNSLGLYVDVEAKRRAKLEKKRAKISKQYLSKMYKDQFFGKLLNKKIIHAEYYFDPSRQDQKNILETVGDLMAFMTGQHYSDAERYSGTAVPKKDKRPEQLQKNVTKISIDELVKLHLEGRLKYEHTDKYKWLAVKFNHGDYFVNYQNPVVKKVVDNLEEISCKVRNTYDVKVLEDRLDTLGEFAKGLGLLVYALSGIGVIHAIYSENSKNVQNPFKNFKPYQALVYGGKAITEALREKEWASDLYQGTKTLLKYAVLLPVYYLPTWSWKIGSKAVTYSAREWIVPGAKALNPVRYPDYARNTFRYVKEYVEDWQEERMRKKMEHILAQADQAKQLPEKAQEKEEPKKEGFFKRTAKHVANYCLEQFTINFITGLGPAPFNNLPADKLKAITARAKVGQMYADFTSAIQDLDEIVAESLGEKPYPVYLAYQRSNNTEHSQGMYLKVNKKGKDPKLYLDLYTCQSLLILTDRVSRERDPATATELSYALLDLLLHQRTHDSLKYYDHYHDNSDSLHPPTFLKRKEKIRREVVRKLAENTIFLPSIVAQRISYVNPEENSMYAIPVYELAALVHLPRFRQPYYREIKKNEEQKRAERQMKNLGPGGQY